MASIFTRIINREIDARIVAETPHFIAFLDAFPVKEGHVLVVPKQEVDDFFDLNADDLASLMRFAQKVAKAMYAVIPCTKISVQVIGLEVPHAHVHLIPINQMMDCNFLKGKLELSSEQMDTICKLIADSYLTMFAE